MGRPKKDLLSKRSKQVRLRVTEAEYFWMKHLAEKEQTDVSSLLRNAFKDHIRSTLNDDEIAEIVVKVVKDLKK